MVVVLNFGGQFAHLITRRVRDLGVKAEILPFNTTPEKILSYQPKGIILSGGPASVTERGAPRPSPRIFDLDLPVLGICYGQQLMAAMLGGVVQGHKQKEFGREVIALHSRTGIFRGLRLKEVVWFSHGDQVVKLPPGFFKTASTKTCPVAAMAHKIKPFFGVQFHPEVAHTEHGKQLLSNFLFKVCCAHKDWMVQTVRKELIHSLKKQIGSDHVVVGISGGVDSMVAATLLSRAVGRQLHAVFVDTGLLREGEVKEVAASLRALRLKNLHVVQAAPLFLKRLKGVRNPERKRKIIGHTFIEVFERTIRKLRKYPIRYFAQGTIYPDRIESAEPTKVAAKIKSHHNLSIPSTFDFKIVEPLRDLYKDEVRKLGESLGLPKELLWRHPFPGPGLAVHIVGEITPERLRILREADAIYLEELKRVREYSKIWQAFAVLLPLKTVGVMGDARTYDYIIALRAVDSIDGMTADWHKFPPELLERISNRIVREVRGVNRVVYDVTQKPPATIEYE